MASIEYGIDEYGRKIYAQAAYRGKTYICPYCSEEIHVFKCYDKEDYFAHMPIANRTPKQRICPGYTGAGAYGRIEDEIDKVCITNGGLPLYLCAFADGKYKLDAYFPPLSQETADLLNEWGTRVVIKEYKGKEDSFNCDIRVYRVKTTVGWIEIKCTNLKYPIPEVRQKWEWGIRGLDCESDIFHSHYDGGCRVALHSNIVVGKEYLIINRYNNITEVEGMSFTEKGILRFNDLYCSPNYYVYAMMVKSVTDESRAYIQKKGYQLIEQSDEIIPMWPPAVIEGKELIYRRNKNNAFLFHNKRSEQIVSYIGDYSLFGIFENDNVINVNTNNKTLLLSDSKFNKLSCEIRFMLTQTRNNFDNEQMFIPCVKWKNDESALKPLILNDLDILKERKLFFEANCDINIYILKNNYVELSSKRIVEGIKRDRKVVINTDPFETKWFEYKNDIKKQNDYKQKYIKELVKAMYFYNSFFVPFPNEFIEVWDYAKDNSPELYRVMMQWRQKIPFAAINCLSLIKEALKNEQYG